MTISNVLVSDIELFVFDFDGVLTDNSVYLNQDGSESVRCSRSDGLAFDVLRKLKKSTYILSTEENIVVSSRAEKLRVPVLQGIKNKENAIRSLADSEGCQLKNILYIGNDINDFTAMKICGYAACPADSHLKIKKLSNIVLNTNGGHGVVRELLEDVLNLDFIKILY